MMQSKIYGDRIRQARHLRNMMSKDLASAVEWTPMRTSRNEQSESLLVNDVELAALGRVLRFPVNFFGMPPAPQISATGLLYRAPQRTTLREKEFLTSFGRLVADVTQVLDSQFRMPGVSVPAVPTGVEPEEAAGLTRLALKLELDEPIGYLTHLVEKAGVPVVVRLGETDLMDLYRDGPVDSVEQHSGCSGLFGEFAERPIIMMRSRQSWDRTRLTLAHELGHVVLHRNGVTPHAEEEAFRFAAEFLAPIVSISRDLPRHPTLSSLYPVKMKWGISIGALIRHLRRADVFTQEQFRRLQAQLYSRINPATGKTWGATEPGWNERSPEMPRLLSKWLEACYGSATPQVIAATANLWPVDLLTQMLRSQRPGGATASSPERPRGPTNAQPARALLPLPIPEISTAGEVVDFSAARKARRG